MTRSWSWSCLGVGCGDAAALRVGCVRGALRRGRTLLAAVDELASVRALSRGPLHIVLLVVVAVVELDLGDRRTTSRVVDDVLDDTAHVAVALSVVEDAQTARTLAVLGVRCEDGAATLTLTTDNTTPVWQTRRQGRTARGM